MAWALLPLSSPSPGGFTEEAKRKVLDTLGFQSMQLEQSTWCVAQPGCGAGQLQHCHAGGIGRDMLEGRGGLPNAPDPPGGEGGQGAGVRPAQHAGVASAPHMLGSHHLLPVPSEGRGAFPGAEIYHMVEQVNGHLKESILKALEEER